MLAQANFDINALESSTSLTFAGDKPGDIIFASFNYIFFIAGVALLLYLLMGGFQLMTSRGEPKGVEMGKTKITNALVGFLVVFFAYFLVQIIGRFLGVEAIQNIFG